METIAEIRAAQEGMPASAYELEANAAHLRKAFDEYVDLRIRGYWPNECYSIAFGMPTDRQNMHDIIRAIENNPYVKRNLLPLLSSAQLEHLWNQKLSIWEMLQLVRNPFTPAPARLATIKELNVVCGITAIDDKGRTVPGLEHFYGQGRDPVSKAISEHPSQPAE